MKNAFRVLRDQSEKRQIQRAEKEGKEKENGQRDRRLPKCSSKYTQRAERKLKKLLEDLNEKDKD